MMHKYALTPIIITLFFVFLFSCATIPDPVSPPIPKPSGLFYTTDSEISPREIMTWDVIYRTSPNDLGIYYIVAANPLLRLPVYCPIKYILCLLDNTKQRLIGYAYYLDGQLELYELRAKDPSLDSGHFACSPATEHKREVIDFYLLKFLDTELKQRLRMDLDKERI